MSTLKVYGTDLSPPTRSVLLTLKALKLQFEYVHVNLMGREHHSADYLKKNPQHTVPTLEDTGHFIWDSHAIMAYLVRKYGRTDALYPKDYLKRAKVDQRLHFENDAVFAALKNISRPLLLKFETTVGKYKYDAITDAYNYLEGFLEDDPYVAGNQLSIADFSLITSILALTTFLELDKSKYPNITAWIARLKALPYFAETNDKGAEEYKTTVLSLIQQMLPNNHTISAK